LKKSEDVSIEASMELSSFFLSENYKLLLTAVLMEALFLLLNLECFGLVLFLAERVN